MAQDIRELFKNSKVTHQEMPESHEARFLNKLDQALPQKSQGYPNWMKIAAAIVVFLGLGMGAFQIFKVENNEESSTEVATAKPIENKTLGDISPGLKKVEDYYLASINLELSKIDPTPETKELLDGYLEQLEVLDRAYQKLSEELSTSGPSELTVNALIDNLKLRLNLLYRLRSQLQILKNGEDLGDASQQNI
ncbi:hypothetical protein KO493_12335 [Tamlana agarivorans]|uniref:Uncharacterized protein n=1 Tax=Pseudotamlana agarivorans TaxID=481183 RepID=A0ACC5UB09_9FLAO|nr:hypothetical protein [Tamlana agarivorans]MBU2951485.1 hypothetical protein [Tamlana agarivorans]